VLLGAGAGGEEVGAGGEAPELGRREGTKKWVADSQRA